jgi:tetratricopeptide (TPR) repeat protein
MKSLVKAVLVAAILLSASGRDARSQANPDVMQEGIVAFRAERYEEAAGAFERVVDADPENAEAYFLLARIYFETPLKDDKRAGSMLDRALELEPQNVQYLVARLEHLRAESSNFFAEKVRESKRQRLANQILELDSTNSFAHEELGILAIRDFWRYRNAVSMPYLGFQPTDYNLEGSPAFEPTDERDPTLPPGSGENPVQNVFIPPTNFDPDMVNMDDRFDIETLESQGVVIQKLSDRAERAYDLAVVHLEKSLSTDPRRAQGRIRGSPRTAWSHV